MTYVSTLQPPPLSTDNMKDKAVESALGVIIANRTKWLGFHFVGAWRGFHFARPLLLAAACSAALALALVAVFTRPPAPRPWANMAGSLRAPAPPPDAKIGAPSLGRQTTPGKLPGHSTAKRSNLRAPRMTCARRPDNTGATTSRRLGTGQIAYRSRNLRVEPLFCCALIAG